MLTIVSSFAAMIKRCLILSSLLVHAHAAVWADEAPADSLSTTLEEVSVTALKRLNPVMQEPEAVTILTEAELDIRYATMRADLLKKNYDVEILASIPLISPA